MLERCASSAWAPPLGGLQRARPQARCRSDARAPQDDCPRQVRRVARFAKLSKPSRWLRREPRSRRRVSGGSEMRHARPNASPRSKLPQRQVGRDAEQAEASVIPPNGSIGRYAVMKEAARARRHANGDARVSRIGAPGGDSRTPSPGQSPMRCGSASCHWVDEPPRTVAPPTTRRTAARADGRRAGRDDRRCLWSFLAPPPPERRNHRTSASSAASKTSAAPDAAAASARA